MVGNDRFELHKGDCLEIMKDILDESIDIIITSPPYNIGKMHSNKTQFGTYSGNDMKEFDYQQWQLDIFKEYKRILKPDGSIFYNHKVRIKNGKAINPLEWILKTDFILKQEITWNQKKSANCDKIRFFPFSERIYWLTKDPKVKIKNNLCLSDVWECVPSHKRKETGHIAVMPDKIVFNILSSIENIEEKTVLDNFLGSGTTGKVCRDFNVKKFIGIELSDEYYALAYNRINNLIHT